MSLTIASAAKLTDLWSAEELTRPAAETTPLLSTIRVTDDLLIRWTGDIRTKVRAIWPDGTWCVWLFDGTCTKDRFAGNMQELVKWIKEVHTDEWCMLYQPGDFQGMINFDYNPVVAELNKKAMDTFGPAILRYTLGKEGFYRNECERLILSIYRNYIDRKIIAGKTPTEPVKEPDFAEKLFGKPGSVTTETILW